MKFLAFVLVVLLSVPVFAQDSEEVAPSTLVIRVDHELATRLTSLFAGVETRDPQKLALTIAEGNSDLGMPQLGRVSVRPFAPQHSVVLPELRRATNPDLFADFGNSIRPKASEALIDAEDKIARLFVITYSSSLTPSEAATVLRKNSLIELAEPKYIRHPLYKPNDPQVASDRQYSLDAMKVIEAWDIVRCDSTMILADVDVGCDWSHEDLEGAIYKNQGEIGVDREGIDKRANGIDDDKNGFVDDWQGWDFGGTSDGMSDNDTRSFSDHGTHTTGIIAASGNNDIGVAGVAFGSRIIPIKGGHDEGSSVGFGFEGIIYAADMGAKVVNCSWGGPSRSQAEQDVINYAYAKDIVVVAAAGNNGRYQDFYPATYNHVLSVAAMDFSTEPSSFTNYGTKVDVVAPGSSILSTVNNDRYAEQSGTSMAAPNAAGCLALVRQRFPNYSADQALERLRATSDPIKGFGNSDLLGHGRINAYRAVHDNIAFSARIEDVVINDANGSGFLDPSENAGIVLVVRNYLDRLEQLSARVEVIEGKDYVSIVDSIVPFGAVNSMRTIENIQAAFKVVAAESAPANTRILIKVTFYDWSVGYYDDIDYFAFVISPNWRDLKSNDLTVTIDSRAGIGYTNPPENSQGSGFLWSKRPPEISPKGSSLLWYGGLMIGQSAGKVAAAAPSFSPSFADQDFIPFESVTPVQPDKVGAVQQLRSHYYDSTDVGVEVTQNSYQFNRGLSSRAIVLDYLLRKINNPDLGLAPNDSISAALFFDWDIGLGGSMNRASLASDGITTITERLEPGYPVIASSVISEIPNGAALQLHALNNDGSDGTPNTYDGFSDDEKWRTLTETRTSAGIGDVTQVIGLKQLALASSDSIRMTVVVAVGASANEAIAAVQATEDEWFGRLAVRTPSEVSKLTLEQNPFGPFLSLSWPMESAGAAKIEVVDALGRIVLQTTATEGHVTLPTSGISSGSYLIRVSQAGRTYQTQAVHLN